MPQVCIDENGKVIGELKYTGVRPKFLETLLGRRVDINMSMFEVRQRMKPMFKGRFLPPPKGFTLSELLIAVAILGLIATFTIPKILNRVDFSVRKSQAKDTIASLQNILYAGIANDDFSSPFRTYDYFAPKLNATKVCSSNSTTEGCHSGQSNISPNYWIGSEAIVLHSGVVIFTGYQPHANAGNSAAFLVDLNGSNGPNKESED